MAQKKPMQVSGSGFSGNAISSLNFDSLRYYLQLQSSERQWIMPHPDQDSIQFSGYADLYDIVVPQDHELRKLNTLCENFDFIYDELKDKYYLDNGRMAEDP